MKESKRNWLARTAVLALILGALVFSACGDNEDDAKTDAYTVKVAAGVANGTISVSPVSGVAGTLITVTVNPTAGYILKDGSLVYNDGVADVPIAKVGGVYTFTLPATNVTVSAVFESVPSGSYTVTIAALTNGSITAEPQFGTQGTTITLTITPNTGYILKDGTLKYNDGNADQTISGSTFILPAASVTVSAQFERATSADNLVSTGIDALLEGNVDNAVGYFNSAYASFPSDEEAIVYSSLASLASIPVSAEFRQLVSDRFGVTNYPGTINGLLSGDWFQDYYEKVREYYDATIEKWVYWYDADDGWWTPNGYTVPGYYYYDYSDSRYKLATSTPKYETASFFGFTAPDWFQSKDIYTNSLATVGGNVVYTTALQTPLLFASLLDKNTTGLNGLLDEVITVVFGAKLDQIETRIAALGNKTIEVDEKIIEALGLDELLEGETVSVGKAEVSLILASLRVVKGSLEFLQAYDWSTDLSFLKTAAWDETIIDNIPASSLPLKSNFLKDRNNGALAKAKTDYIKAIDAVVDAYTVITGDTGRYPQAALDQIQEFAWVKDGLTKLKTAVNSGTVFHVKEASGSTYDNTAADAQFSVNMDKLFTAGQLSLSNLVITETGKTDTPQFYGYDEDGDETAITAESELAGYEYIGFKLKLDKVKEIVGDAIPSDVDELLLFAFSPEIAETLYAKYH